MFILDLSLCRTDRNEKYVLEKSTNDKVLMTESRSCLFVVRKVLRVWDKIEWMVCYPGLNYHSRGCYL